MTCKIWGPKLQSTQTVLLHFSFHSTGHSLYTFVYFQPHKIDKRATQFLKATFFVIQYLPLATVLRSTDCLARTWDQPPSPYTGMPISPQYIAGLRKIHFIPSTDDVQVWSEEESSQCIPPSRQLDCQICFRLHMNPPYVYILVATHNKYKPDFSTIACARLAKPQVQKQHPGSSTQTASPVERTNSG